MTFNDLQLINTFLQFDLKTPYSLLDNKGEVLTHLTEIDFISSQEDSLDITYLLEGFVILMKNKQSGIRKLKVSHNKVWLEGAGKSSLTKITSEAQKILEVLKPHIGTSVINRMGWRFVWYWDTDRRLLKSTLSGTDVQSIITRRDINDQFKLRLEVGRGSKEEDNVTKEGILIDADISNNGASTWEELLNEITTIRELVTEPATFIDFCKTVTGE